MRKPTFVATALVATLVAAAPLASAQNRQRRPSQGDNGNRGGGEQQRASGGEQRGGGQRAERQAQPRDGGRVQAPREQQDNGRREAAAAAPQGRREVVPQERREPQQGLAPRNDGNRRADGRRDGVNDGRSSGRYAVPRTYAAPRYRDGDRRVYVQPRHNYYVYRYPSYRYVTPRYYSYRYYDPYFSGDFYWSNYAWQPRSYYYGSNWDYDLGKLRLDIEQRDAEVYIDGYYAGLVDEFDGRLQGLRLEPGNYRVEIALPGFAPLQFDVAITPGRTTTYRGSLLPEP